MECCPSDAASEDGALDGQANQAELEVTMLREAQLDSGVSYQLLRLQHGARGPAYAQWFPPPDGGLRAHAQPPLLWDLVPNDQGPLLREFGMLASYTFLDGFLLTHLGDVDQPLYTVWDPSSMRRLFQHVHGLQRAGIDVSFFAERLRELLDPRLTAFDVTGAPQFECRGGHRTRAECGVGQQSERGHSGGRAGQRTAASLSRSSASPARQSAR